MLGSILRPRQTVGFCNLLLLNGIKRKRQRRPRARPTRDSIEARAIMSRLHSIIFGALAQCYLCSLDRIIFKLPNELSHDLDATLAAVVAGNFGRKFSLK